MDPQAIGALIGAAVLAFIVRVFNVVAAWLARVLDVDAPDPIPTRTGDRSAHGRTEPNPVESAAPGVPPVDQSGPPV